MLHPVALRAMARQPDLPNPVQANYLQQQPLNNASYWNNITNLTAQSDGVTLLESAVNADHHISRAAYMGGLIPRAAAIKTFVCHVDAEPIGPRSLGMLVFDGSFAHSAGCTFNLVTGSKFDPVGGGSWTDNDVSFIIRAPNMNGRYRCGFEFTTDGASTEFNVQFVVYGPNTESSYLGDVGLGMRLSNFWLYNKNAAAGGL